VVLKLRHRIVFSIVYTIVYLFLAVAAVNPKGTGTNIFFSPLIAWPLLLAALFFLNKTDEFRTRMFFVVFMLSHYAISIVLIYLFWADTYDGRSRIEGMWERDPQWVIFAVSWYLAGQSAIWIGYIRFKGRRSADNS